MEVDGVFTFSEVCIVQILEYEIKMIKIKYNKGENTYELDVLPEEIEYKSRM